MAGWKDKLRQVAEQGKAVAEQGKAKLAEHQEQRAQQWRDDPATLWYGESKDAAASATGLAKARYRITADRVWIDAGLLGTRTETSSPRRRPSCSAADAAVRLRRPARVQAPPTSQDDRQGPPVSGLTKLPGPSG